MYGIKFHTKEEMYKFAEDSFLNNEMVEIIELRLKRVPTTRQYQLLHISRATYFRRIKEIYYIYEYWKKWDFFETFFVKICVIIEKQ